MQLDIVNTLIRIVGNIFKGIWFQLEASIVFICSNILTYYFLYPQIQNNVNIFVMFTLSLCIGVWLSLVPFLYKSDKKVGILMSFLKYMYVQYIKPNLVYKKSSSSAEAVIQLEEMRTYPIQVDSFEIKPVEAYSWQTKD